MSEETTRQMPGEVFFENLSEINEGALLTALDKKMADLVAAVLTTGNNGTLTLKLSCKRKGGVNQVVIEPKVTASIPDPTIAPRIMFADTSGALHTDDPAQGKLPCIIWIAWATRLRVKLGVWNYWTWKR